MAVRKIRVLHVHRQKAKSTRASCRYNIIVVSLSSLISIMEQWNYTVTQTWDGRGRGDVGICLLVENGFTTSNSDAYSSVNLCFTCSYKHISTCKPCFCERLSSGLIVASWFGQLWFPFCCWLSSAKIVQVIEFNLLLEGYVVMTGRTNYLAFHLVWSIC